MTRLASTARATAPARHFDLAAAFRYLGQRKSYDDLRLVVDMLHKSGVTELDYDQELQDLAEANGSMAIVALDLVTAFHHGVEALYAGPRHGTRDEDP